jgi:hypothetical protein
MVEEIKTEQKQSRTRGLIPFKPGQCGNPNGRPEGSKNFSTLFEEVARDIAKNKSKDVNEIRKSLIKMGVKKALKGNFKFYQDIMDRDLGQAKKNIDITSGGETLVPSQEERARANKALSEM